MSFRVLTSTCFFLLLQLTVGCSLFSSPAPEIVFVIPDGFKGLVVLDSQATDGYEATPVNNVITMPVGNDGKVSIKGRLPTLKWSRLSARFASGQQIPVASQAESLPDDAVAFREAGLVGDKQDWFVVGTQEDLKKALEKKWGFKYEPNSR